MHLARGPTGLDPATTPNARHSKSKPYVPPDQAGRQELAATGSTTRRPGAQLIMGHLRHVDGVLFHAGAPAHGVEISGAELGGLACKLIGCWCVNGVFKRRELRWGAPCLRPDPGPRPSALVCRSQTTKICGQVCRPLEGFGRGMELPGSTLGVGPGPRLDVEVPCCKGSTLPCWSRARLVLSCRCAWGGRSFELWRR